MSRQIPYLRKTETSHQLVVNGKPILLLGGELQNSSMSSAAYMRTKWQHIADSNINFVLGSVSWEDIEPEEGVFDFTQLDDCIRDARQYGIHIGILWFGSFKNGMSSYAPGWAKKDSKRFPRIVIQPPGGPEQYPEVLSVFHNESKLADAKAFASLMKHVKETDEAHSTIVLIQVENEVGILKDTRDRSEAANKAFTSPVPSQLINALITKWETLNALIQHHLKKFRESVTAGSAGDWESTFGISSFTDELFMAYHYALYLEEVAAAGKREFPLPYFANCWQNSTQEDFEAIFAQMRPEEREFTLKHVSSMMSASEGNPGQTAIGGGTKAGHYPSGGPLYDVIDVWHEFAPSLSFLSPDLYMNDFAVTCRKYRHNNQPLFIPEMRRDQPGALRLWVAFGSYQAIGTCPFGVDTIEPSSFLSKQYALLSSVSTIILEAQAKAPLKAILGPNDEEYTEISSRETLARAPPTSSTFGFFYDPLPDWWTPPPMNPTDIYSSPEEPHIARFGDLELQVTRAYVTGRPGPGAGMIIHLSGYKFLLIGWGFRVKFRSLNPKAKYTGILSFKEKEVVDPKTGELRTRRSLNGDETMGGAYVNMPSENPDTGTFCVNITIPGETFIAEAEAYVLLE